MFLSGRFHSFKTSPEKACNHHYLEIANGGPAYVALVFDCDRPGNDGMTGFIDYQVFDWHILSW